MKIISGVFVSWFFSIATSRPQLREFEYFDFFLSSSHRKNKLDPFPPAASSSSSISPSIEVALLCVCEWRSRLCARTGTREHLDDKLCTINYTSSSRSRFDPVKMKTTPASGRNIVGVSVIVARVVINSFKCCSELVLGWCVVVASP